MMSPEDILTNKLNTLRTYSYKELKSFIDNPPDVDEVDINGKEYQVDTRCFIEDGRSKTIRVTVSIFAPKEINPWWKFWKNIDKAIVSDSFEVTR